MGINKEFMAVKEFHEAFGHPVSETPVSMSKERAKARYEWLLEEINEFLEAVDNEDIVEQADAMIDTIYFALGTLVEMGVKPEKLFDIVQNANMSKLWEDGKPHYNELGKVIKPKGWVDPHPLLEEEIKSQMGSEPMLHIAPIYYTASKQFEFDGSSNSYTLEVQIWAESLTLNDSWSDISNITDISLTATNNETKEVFTFDADRIRQAFSYFAGNVENGIIEYFDWEYVYLMCIEELE